MCPHSKNTKQEIQKCKLAEVANSARAPKKYISALYTNISIQYSIDAVIELAEEHWEELDTFGLT